MIKQLTTIFLMGLLSFLYGCNTKTQQTNSLSDITSRIDPTEGWSDIFLTMTADTKTDTSHIYIAKGLYKGKTVGLQIEVSSKIGAGIIDGKPDPKFGFIANAI
ncbi:MAG: hypothetical protein WAQ28_18460 [Bacteroidia bacterium]